MSGIISKLHIDDATVRWDAPHYIFSVTSGACRYERIMAPAACVLLFKRMQLAFLDSRQFAREHDALFSPDHGARELLRRIESRL